MRWRYCIIHKDKITEQIAKLGNYSSPRFMRHSNTNNILVKWQGDKPECLKGYDEIDIKKELEKEEWQVEDEI